MQHIATDNSAANFYRFIYAVDSAAILEESFYL